jgi:hypothetical protein
MRKSSRNSELPRLNIERKSRLLREWNRGKRGAASVTFDGIGPHHKGEAIKRIDELNDADPYFVTTEFRQELEAFNIAQETLIENIPQSLQPEKQNVVLKTVLKRVDAINRGLPLPNLPPNLTNDQLDLIKATTTNRTYRGVLDTLKKADTDEEVIKEVERLVERIQKFKFVEYIALGAIDERQVEQIRFILLNRFGVIVKKVIDSNPTLDAQDFHQRLASSENDVVILMVDKTKSELWVRLQIDPDEEKVHLRSVKAINYKKTPQGQERGALFQTITAAVDPKSGSAKFVFMQNLEDNGKVAKFTSGLLKSDLKVLTSLDQNRRILEKSGIRNYLIFRLKFIFLVKNPKKFRQEIKKRFRKDVLAKYAKYEEVNMHDLKNEAEDLKL